MRTLVVIPTYNEADNIDEVISRLRAAVPDAEVLVVDDNSPDGTADLVETLAERDDRVHVLRRPGKAGLGSAYRAGFAWGADGGFEVMVEMDADLSHDPAALPTLLQGVDEGADLAIGSRYVPGGSTPDWPLLRRLISRAGNIYARLMLGIPVRDATAGFRAFRADALRRLPYQKARASGYGFQVEMAWRAHQSGLAITEVPISFRDRTRGKSKMGPQIVAEAMMLVTIWGLGRLVGRRPPQ